MPIVSLLVKSDSFKYFEVFIWLIKTNLDEHCPFWETSMLCTLPDCSVSPADIDNVPLKFKKATLSKVKFPSLGGFGETAGSRCSYAESDFCLVDEWAPANQVINLVENPERYTGYAGESAANVWSAIYNENCLHVEPQLKGGLETCIEERVFYKLVSGLFNLT